MTRRRSEIDRLSQLVALLADEWRRLEAGRSLDQREPRPEPPPFVDLTPFDGLSDKQVAKQVLGSSGREAAALVAEERSGQYDRAMPPGRSRCEAGVKMWGLLRCHRSAVPESRWCNQHHPTPPPGLYAQTRLSEWDLRLRPDGELLRAVYKQTDRIDHLSALVNRALERLDQVEQVSAGDAPQPGDLLTVKEAAELLGLSPGYVYRMCKENRLPFVRLGNSLRFRRGDLDEWLRKKVVRHVRSPGQSVAHGSSGGRRRPRCAVGCTGSSGNAAGNCRRLQQVIEDVDAQQIPNREELTRRLDEAVGEFKSGSGLAESYDRLRAALDDNDGARFQAEMDYIYDVCEDVQS